MPVTELHIIRLALAIHDWLPVDHAVHPEPGADAALHAVADAETQGAAVDERGRAVPQVVVALRNGLDGKRPEEVVVPRADGRATLGGTDQVM